jgi:diguanylate cyclase (GGDEF)-like protein
VGGVVSASPGWLPPHRHGQLYNSIIPWGGAALSFLAIIMGQFSYPRIQNPKVYLSGYGVGVVGLAFFCMQALQKSDLLPPSTALHPLLYLLAGANLVAPAFVPSQLKYRHIRTLTWIVMGVEAGVVLSAVLMAQWWSFLILTDSYLLAGLLGLGAVTLICATTLWRIGDDFHLGGILSGVGALYFIGLLAATHPEFDIRLESSSWAVVPLFFVLSTLFHWFARMDHRLAFDPLLQIHNRDYCMKILQEQSSHNLKPPLTIAMVDIDHFKKVNDSYGHQAGDRVLQEVAQLVQRTIGAGGVVCRYGGEEFAVFFSQRQAAGVKEVMEGVRTKIEQSTIDIGKRTIKVTVSCGICERSDLSQPMSAVLASADKALYRAKGGGRNQVKVGKLPGGSPTRKNGRAGGA